MEKLSLLKILRNDEYFAAALQRKKEAVKKDKEGLLKEATKYTEQYKDEIKEGTQLRQKLLNDGQSRGLTEEEIFKGIKKFIPTESTPILNYLFFIMRDVPPTKTIEQVLTEYIEKFGYDKSTITELYLKGVAENVDELSIEEKTTNFEDEIDEDITNNPDDMDSYLFDKIGHTVIKKIKKLKALSYSKNNSSEAALAYKKCRELCDEYNVDFNKIKCGLEDE